jgi:exportin-1
LCFALTTHATRLHQDLTDFSKPFDVGLLDRVVMAFYTSGNAKEVYKDGLYLRAQLTMSYLATTCSAGVDAIPRTSRCLDASSRNSGTFTISPSEGAKENSLSLYSFLKVSQYIGLQILEKLITTRWKALPEGQRQGRDSRHSSYTQVDSWMIKALGTLLLERLSK